MKRLLILKKSDSKEYRNSHKMCCMPWLEQITDIKTARRMTLLLGMRVYLTSLEDFRIKVIKFVIGKNVRLEEVLTLIYGVL